MVLLSPRPGGRVPASVRVGAGGWAAPQPGDHAGPRRQPQAAPALAAALAQALGTRHSHTYFKKKNFFSVSLIGVACEPVYPSSSHTAH